ncbi:uncharacterized protein LOC129907731 [Episyrphus balteatus]|uniref:uncharacterized protein LOC129907731 n=1 Tax=Episyrphus balteatus TaxID=286459 RepID=UPI00248566AA|nr:uncharacterized protein LOC129907731 [Episyrphus balteatus]
MWFKKSLIFSWNICTFLWIQVEALDYVIHFDRIENIKGENEDLVNFTDWEIEGRGSNYLVNGNFTFETDMDDLITHELKFEISPFRNNAFMVNSIHRNSVCDYYKKNYKEFAEKIMMGHTNFPEIPPGGLCPIPKGNYYIKDAVLDEKDLPKILARGLWRINKKFFKGKKCIGGVTIYADVKNKE